MLVADTAVTEGENVAAVVEVITEGAEEMVGIVVWGTGAGAIVGAIVEEIVGAVGGGMVRGDCDALILDASALALASIKL